MPSISLSQEDLKLLAESDDTLRSDASEVSQRRGRMPIPNPAGIPNLAVPLTKDVLAQENLKHQKELEIQQLKSDMLSKMDQLETRLARTVK